MKNVATTFIAICIFVSALSGCADPKPSAEAVSTPTSTITFMPSETPTVKPTLTPTATARIKVTTTPIPNTTTHAGEWSEFGGGRVRTWVRLDANGHPHAIGVQFSEEMLSDLGALKSITMVLPPEAGVSPFYNVDLDWRPQGHNPKEYRKAHFDFRFFLITEENRGLIKDEHFDTNYIKPEPKYVPAFYAPAEITFRVDYNVGQRFWSMKSPEVDGDPFIQSLNFGFWHGHLVYVEPMITLAFLESRENYMGEILQPREYEKSGFYPTMYRIEYVADSGEYIISLENFVER